MTETDRLAEELAAAKRIASEYLESAQDATKELTKLRDAIYELRSLPSFWEKLNIGKSYDFQDGVKWAGEEMLRVTKAALDRRAR